MSGAAATVRLPRPAVQRPCPIVRAKRPIEHSDCPPARLKCPTGCADGEVVRAARAVGHAEWPIGQPTRTLPECPLMAERRFPRPDGDFSAYMNHYYEAVEKWWNIQGLDLNDLTDL